METEREKTTVISDEVHLDVWENVAEPRVSFDYMCTAIVDALPLPRRQHQLKIHIIEHPNFEIHRS